MSYILEALEKSEEERKQHTVPNLQTQPTIYPGVTRSRTRRLKKNSRRFSPSILLTVLLLGTVWFFREHLPVAMEIKITQQTAQKGIIPKESDSAPPAAPAEKPRPAADGGRKAEQQTVAAESVPPPAEQQAAVDKPPATPSSAENRTEEPVSPASTPVVDQREQTVITRKNAKLQPSPIVLTDSGHPGSVTVAPPLPFLDDLPASVRGELPKLKFAGHTYSAIPQDRLIIINSGIKRQGDLVESGLKLEEITWDGVILDFRGMRFQVITTAGE